MLINLLEIKFKANKANKMPTLNVKRGVQKSRMN